MKNKKIIISIVSIISVLVIALVLTFSIGYTQLINSQEELFENNHNVMVRHLNSSNKSPNLWYDNIILLIGDGMGFNQIEATKKELGLSQLFMETLPSKSKSQTRSYDNKITDSAAGATALATGYRTFNGEISKLGTKNLKTITNFAQDLNKKTGIVTTDDTYGATPAAFSSLSIKRSYYKTIVKGQAESNVDYIVGGNVSGSGIDKNYNKLVDNNYTIIRNYSDLPTHSTGKYYGVIDNLYSKYESENNIELVDVAKNAIEFLDNENGFFLMIEGARIDKNNHKNNLEGMTKELHDFDKTVEYCVNWAQTKGHTLVIVTADHESGGLIENNGEYTYTTTKHTGDDVPLFVYGANLTKDSYMNVNIFSLMLWALERKPIQI